MITLARLTMLWGALQYNYEFLGRTASLELPGY